MNEDWDDYVETAKQKVFERDRTAQMIITLDRELGRMRDRITELELLVMRLQAKTR